MVRTLLAIVGVAGCAFDSRTAGESAASIGEGSSTQTSGGSDNGSESGDEPLATTTGEFDGPAKQRIDLALEAVEGLAGAPLLVILGADRIDYQRALPDGSDLAFYGPELTEPLHAEVEHWAPDGASYVWVRLPEPAPDHLFMAYGTGVPHNGDGLALWDDFDAVWHFAGDPEAQGILDTTANGHDGTLRAPTAAAHGAGLVGNAITLDGEDAVVEFEAGGPKLRDQMTIEAWARIDELDPGAAQYVVLKRDAYFIRALEQTLVQPRAGVRLKDDELLEAGPNSSLAARWTYLVTTFDGSQLRMYVDGEEVDVALAATGGELGEPDEPLLLGRSFPGSLDEVRISARTRSPAWIAGQYASMSDTVLTFGDPEPL